jgi:Icc-related predicted phosphoesterase
MKLVYATDMHGDSGAYEALATLASGEEADVVLLGGDLFAYSREAAPQLTFAEGPFRRFLTTLATAAIPVLAIPGNVDRPATIARLREFEYHGWLQLLGLQPYRLALPRDGAETLDVVGYPHVPPTPFRLKDHERRDLSGGRYNETRSIFVSSPEPDGAPVEMPADHLDRLPSIEDELATVPTTGRCCLLVAHSPPWGGALDLSDSGVHAGSRALRGWIEQRQPLLALHGHIHEAADRSGRWVERIGRTLCINPGLSTETLLQAVLAETTDLPRSLRHTQRGQSDL